MTQASEWLVHKEEYKKIELLEFVKNEIEYIKNGELFINLEQLKDLQEVENIYIENCSGTNKGYNIYLIDEEGNLEEKIMKLVVREK